jgi:parallel beta-helix repeat protein
MNKKIAALWLILILIISSIVILLVFSPCAEASTTYYVGGSGPANYTSIQAAIDAANPGDTVFVHSGTYYENVVVDKTINLIGENQNTTIIDGGNADDVIEITSSGVNITEFTLDNGDGNAAIRIKSDHATISEITALGADFGVLISSVSYNTIINCNLSNHGAAGILILSASLNTIIDNEISENRYGIHLASSTENTLIDNAMFGTGILMGGDSLDHWNGNSIDTSNSVNGKPIYYWKDKTGGIVPAGAGQVILVNCTNVTIENQDLTYTTSSIQLGFSSNNEIINNNLSSSHWDGIYLEYSNENNITSNIVDNNNCHSIFLKGSHGNNISYNTISNGDYGIYITSSSEANNIYGNTVLKNYCGIHFFISSNNKIFHNNIIDNTYQAEDNQADNHWDSGYPSSGNYWSNYRGSDTFNGPNQNIPGSDGIGDTPYDINIINSDSVDHYPLMNSWDPSSSPPSSPSGLTVSAGITYANLTWKAPLSEGGFPITNYIVYRGTISDNISFYRKVDNILVFNDTNVIGGVPYYYKVSAVNLLGEGPQSTEASGLPTSLPGEPINLTMNSGDSFVNLTWNAPVSDGGSPITNYRIYRETESGTETFLTEIGNILYYNDTNVTNGVEYYYKVSAINEFGEGVISNEVSTPTSKLSTSIPEKGLPWWLWITYAISIAFILSGFVVNHVRYRIKMK